MTPVIEFDEARHRYTVDNEVYPSVTQILGVLDKSGPLTWWAQKIGVQGLLELRNRNVRIPWNDADEIVRLLVTHKLTTNHAKRQAGTRGTSLHTALENWMRDGVPPNPVDFPEDDHGYVRALARALIALKPEVIDSEVMVASVEHRYAGRYDLRCRVNGKTGLWDLKSSKKVYPESQFPQLEAYEGAAVEMGDEPTDERMILRLGADGDYEVARSTATFEDFLGIKAAWDALQRMKAAQQEAKAAA